MMIQLFATLLIATQPQPVTLDDLQFLPTHDQSFACYDTVNKERLTTVKPEVWMHPLQHHYDYYNWVEFKYKAWNLMTDAQMTHYAPWRRIENLQDLRKLIGAEAYYNGRLPY